MESFLISTILLLAISNQQPKGKSKKETRTREEEHHPTRDVVCIGQVPHFLPYYYFLFFALSPTAYSVGILKAF